MRQLRRWLVCSAATFCACAPAAAAIIYVSPSGNGTNGSSWTNAYTGLQAALAAAAPGDQIWVRGTTNPLYPTIYRPGTNRSDTFTIPIDVKVYGGFAGTEDSDELNLRNEFAHPTYLDGDIGTLNDASDNSYHVVTIVEADRVTTKLSGFVIQNGNANGSGDDEDYGGGIFLAGSGVDGGPSLDRLTIRNNKATSAGGGVYCASFGYWTYLTNCRFEYNSVTSSSGNGGALSTAGTGGVILQNCVFFDNDSAGVGGAIGLTGTVKSFVANCTFNANTATGIELDGVRYGHSIYATELLSVYNTISWGNGTSGLQFDSSSDSDIATYFHNVK